METQENMERELSLGDLFWKILFSWRGIICTGLIFAVLVSGAMYAKAVRGYQAEQKEVTKKELKEIKKDLTAEEKETLVNAKNIQRQIEENENYMNTSEYMKMDPYKVSVLNLQYYIESEFTANYTEDMKRDYTDGVMSLYSTYINSGEMLQKIIDEAELSIEMEYLRELIIGWRDGTAFYVNIKYPDAEKKEVIAEIIKSALIEKEKEYQAIGAHKLKFMSETENIVIDNNLVTTRDAVLNTVTSLKAQLKALKDNMTPEQLVILEEEIIKEKEKIEEPSFGVKNVILGLFAGVFLACVWVVMKVLLDGKLQNTEELRSQYGVRLFGELSAPKDKKRFLPVIDEKLSALKNRNKKKLSLEQQLKIAAANVALSCKQQNISDIYVTGSEYEKMNPQIMDALKKELASQNLKVKEGENIFYNADSLRQAAETGYILFVEQTDCSIYNEISNELRVAGEQKIQVLGAVVLA